MLSNFDACTLTLLLQYIPLAKYSKADLQYVPCIEHDKEAWIRALEQEKERTPSDKMLSKGVLVFIIERLRNMN